MEQENYKYKCVKCQFFVNSKQLYERHINTNKHKNNGLIFLSKSGFVV